MVHTPSRWLQPAALIAAACAAASPPASAQALADTPPTRRADPLDARAAVPPQVHGSSFSTYRPLGRDLSRDWRDANAEVGRIGGWRSDAREAQQAEPAGDAVSPKSPAPSEGAMPMAPDHSGHTMPRKKQP